MKAKLEEVKKETKKKDGEEASRSKGKEQVVEDVIPNLDPPLTEEPFLKAIKALGGKSLEGIPLFNGKMNLELVMEQIEGMENQFECESIPEAQKVKVAKSRLRGATLTCWKYVQEER